MTSLRQVAVPQRISQQTLKQSEELAEVVPLVGNPATRSIQLFDGLADAQPLQRKLRAGSLFRKHKRCRHSGHHPAGQRTREELDLSTEPFGDSATFDFWNPLFQDRPTAGPNRNFFLIAIAF